MSKSRPETPNALLDQDESHTNILGLLDDLQLYEIAAVKFLDSNLEDIFDAIRTGSLKINDISYNLEFLRQQLPFQLLQRVFIQQHSIHELTTSLESSQQWWLDNFSQQARKNHILQNAVHFYVNATHVNPDRKLWPINQEDFITAFQEDEIVLRLNPQYELLKFGIQLSIFQEFIDDTTSVKVE